MDNILVEAVSGFGERLKRAKGSFLERTGVELTQAQLATRVGELIGRKYDQTAAGSWFKGTIPNTLTIAAIAKVYKVSASWLAFNEGVMLAGHHPPLEFRPPGERLERAKDSRKAR